MSHDKQSLDQARDPLAFVFQDTALQYDRYLAGEYDRNYIARQDQWNEHFRHMRAAWQEYIYKTLERGIPRHKMNVAIVGPGMHPVGRDFGRTMVASFLAQVENVVVVDFSTHVIHSAMQDLIANGVRPHRIHGMQYDVTDGYSSAYDTYISRRLNNVETEEQLSRATEQFPSVTMNELNDCLRELEQQADMGKHPPEQFIRGGVNIKRSLALSLEGKPLPIHLWMVPMVLAGTGAAAEDRLWVRYNEVISDIERGARQESDATLADRQRMHERIFQLIGMYNTTIAGNIIPRMLKSNPESRVVAVTDVTTKLEDFGVLPRMYPEDLRQELQHKGVLMKIYPDTWVWGDEPEHTHDVNAFDCRLMQAKPVVPPSISKVPRGETNVLTDLPTDENDSDLQLGQSQGQLEGQSSVTKSEPEQEDPMKESLPGQEPSKPSGALSGTDASVIRLGDVHVAPQAESPNIGMATDGHQDARLVIAPERPMASPPLPGTPSMRSLPSVPPPRL